jgi:hypothetical protein
MKRVYPKKRPPSTIIVDLGIPIPKRYLEVFFGLLEALGGGK